MPKKKSKKQKMPKKFNKSTLRAFNLDTLADIGKKADPDYTLWDKEKKKKKSKKIVIEEILELYGGENKEFEKDERGEEGMPIRWQLFLDEYFENGFNGVEAYRKVYKCAPGTATTNVSRLLKKEAIQEAIAYRFRDQRISKSAIVGELWQIAKSHKDDGKTASTSVQALAVLAKVRGMMRDVVEHRFSDKNPAIFVDVLDKKDRDDIKNAPRIME